MGPAGLPAASGIVHEKAGCVQRCGHVGDFFLDHPVARKGRAKGGAHCRVANRLIEGCLPDAYGHGANPDPAAIECPHEVPKAPSFGAQEVLCGDTAVLEQNLGRVRAPQAKLVFLLSDAKAGISLLENEGADPVRARFVRGASGYHERRGIAGIGDEELRTAQDVVPPALHGPCPSRAGVASRLTLREAEGPELPAHRQVGNVAPLLFLVSEKKNGQGAKRRVRRQREGRRGAGVRDFLQGDDVGEEVGASAAVLLGHGDAQEPQRRHFCHGLEGKAAFFVDLSGKGSNFLSREVPDHVAKERLIFGEVGHDAHG